MVSLSMYKQATLPASEQSVARRLASRLLMTALALACTNALAQTVPGPDPQAPPSSTTTAEQQAAAAKAAATGLRQRLPGHWRDEAFEFIFDRLNDAAYFACAHHG